MESVDLKKLNMNFSDIQIGVIGDCMLDIYHYGIVDRISPEAPVPIFKSNNEEPEYRLGGACNTALNLKKLGVNTSLFGFVGSDINSSYLLSYVLEYEINHFLISLKNFPTITKNRYFSKNQQIIRIDHENTDGEIYDPLSQEKLLNFFLEQYKNFNAIIISDYGKGALYHPILDSILEKCQDVPIFIDPKINNWQFYENAFCITPNWKEFKHACHTPKLKLDDKDMVCQLGQNQCIKFNIDYILLTLGSKGMALIDKDGNWTEQSAIAEEVYDVSGAGDTVIAALAAAYCTGYSMSAAMQLASLAAKVVIAHLGTYAVSNDELQGELVKLLKKGV